MSQNGAIGAAGAADLPLLGATLLAFHDWSILIGTSVFFALGAAILNYLLFALRSSSSSFGSSREASTGRPR